MLTKVNYTLMSLLIILELATLLITIMIIILALEMNPDSELNKHRILNIFSAIFYMLQVKKILKLASLFCIYNY